MFYSQFILAKKGPLGTIWIAAHLERKLRKNQVADTDIGVSVDSILFPDVPIALRLSSHLLLGVVRIYSRKVNYLFDDCSETLLKVRQAFRSTAVDLPPEESTAPYHSITLPETFDLDDFELPDNDFFQGNDHHVSSRDQITLQDTMDGVVYSTSQFGLDERFGDAETSGLDLDEELLLNKVAAAEDDGIKLDSDADPQLSVQPMTSPKQDGDHGMTANAEIMQTDANIRDSGREIEFNEYAQAPCTPGLLEEPNLSNVQETSACDDHLESENQNLKKLSVKENLENTSSKSDLYLGNKNEVDEFMFSNVNPYPVPAKENICLPDDLANPQGELPHAETVEQISSVNHDLSVIPSASVSNNVENWKNGIVGNIESGIHSDDKTNNEDSVEYIMENNNQASLEMEVSRNVRIAGDSNTESHSIPELKEQETRENENPKDSVILDPPVKEMNCHFLRPCITHKNQLDTQNPEGDKSVDPEATASCSLETSERENDPFALKSFTEIQGEGYKETEGPEQVLEENHITSLVSCENNKKSNDQADNVISGDGQVENANISVCSDFPAPEKLLSVPEINAQNNFLVEGTPGQVLGQTDAGVDASLTVIGKKRSFAESALTVHSLNSVDSSTLVQTKRTPESVPDDDDLLSSILVGRKSSVLKVKTTPQPEITNLKRHRPAPRTSASKRKVLMDDNMVLHGDMIRQQLTNTEDIRRIRKKAPCTRPEILMIQKQSLEDEIFNETIFTGVSAEFASLHGQTYDLSQIRVSTEDVNNASSGGAMDLRLTSLDDEFGAYLEAEKDAAISVGPNITLETEIGGSNNVAQPVETQLCEVPAISLDPASDIPEAKSSQEEFLGETAGMDIDANTGDVTAGDEQLVFSDKTNETDASLQISSLGVTDQQLDMFLVEIDANANTEKKDNDIDAVLTDVQTEYLSTTFSPETGGCGTQVLTVDQVIEDNGKNEQVVVNEGSFLYGEEDRAENLVCDGVCQEVNVDASTQAEVNVDLGNLGLDDGQNSYLQEASELNTVDAGISAVDQVDHDGFDYSAAGNDTEFLNYDEEDEEVAEDDDDGGMPNAEETRFIENSGWSSRTRAVAKYLQTMFDKEAERGKKKVLPVDNLLAGKSRKEASRMFFETLVLKTKDYIHVEQTAAFNNINILPRAKLSKSDF